MTYDDRPTKAELDRDAWEMNVHPCQIHGHHFPHDRETNELLPCRVCGMDIDTAEGN